MLNVRRGTSLVVRWLKPCTSSPSGRDSIPGLWTKIPHAARPKIKQAKSTSPGEVWWPPEALQAVSVRAGLALTFAGPKALPHLDGGAALGLWEPPTPHSRSPANTGQVWCCELWILKMTYGQHLVQRRHSGNILWKGDQIVTVSVSFWGFFPWPGPPLVLLSPALQVGPCLDLLSGHLCDSRQLSSARLRTHQGPQLPHSPFCSPIPCLSPHHSHLLCVCSVTTNSLWPHGP